MTTFSSAHELPEIVPEADDYEDDDDGENSDYVSGTGTDTTSLSSSITKYKYENGRRYHAYREGHYAYPNDEAEQDRLDLYHHIWRLRFGGALYLAPLPQGIQRVLDIGTGTGIWAIDFADEFPSAEIIGTDISPIQPRWVPPNVKFEVDDAEETWTFKKNYFDFIHGRNLGGAISNWDRLYEQIYEHLAPGGIVEMKDIDTHFYTDDGTLPPDDPLCKWQDYCNEAAERINRRIAMGPLLRSHLIKAGFEDVTERVVKTPLGIWPADKKEKEVGLYLREMMVEGCEGITIALFTRVLGWTAEQVVKFLTEVKKSFQNRKIHAYSIWYVVWARKPMPKPKGPPPPDPVGTSTSTSVPRKLPPEILPSKVPLEYEID